MSHSTALKIVRETPRFVEEGAWWSSTLRSELHSLHYALNYPEASPPEFAQFAITRYSRVGDTVLDPFCGSGTVALEAVLAGRLVLASDINPLAVLLTRAKLQPADISELMLGLQTLNLMRPVASEQYQKYFAPFYDINTFRELSNLRRFCLERSDRLSSFITLIALSLLHGNSAGFFSVNTHLHQAPTPEEQRSLNLHRGVLPEYRPIVPCMLRKTCAVMRDGCPSVLRRCGEQSVVCSADARNLASVAAGSVDLVAAAPPLAGTSDYLEGLWLKLWFAGISLRGFARGVFADDLEGWQVFINEVLLEWARVTRSGGRAVLLLGKVKHGGTWLDYAEAVADVVAEQLSPFWSVEGTLINTIPRDVIRKVPREKAGTGGGRDRVLVLRRR